MAIMGRLIAWKRMPVRTVQSIRMQDPQQEVVTGLFIQQVIERKLQHWGASLAPWYSTIPAAEGMPLMFCTSEPT